jgi:hypothetical protein
MTEVENLVLEQLRHIRARLDSMDATISELRSDRALFSQQRLTTDQRLLDVTTELVNVTTRLDRVDQRLDRIEKRLDLVEIAP